MFKTIISTIVLLAVCCGPVLAGEDQGNGLKGWIRTMQKKLDLINPRKTMPVTTGVAGVRGAKQEDKAKLYWKGVKEDEPVSEAELKEFTEAIASADQDDREKAARTIETFMQQHPDSPLIPDAKKTLDLVKAEPKKEEAAASAPEPAVPKETPAAEQVTGQAEPAAAAPAVPTDGN